MGEFLYAPVVLGLAHPERVRSGLTGPTGQSREAIYDQPTVQIGDLVLSPGYYEVRHAGRLLQLTRLEFRLLYLLVSQAHRVVPYGRLVSEALGYSDEEASSALLKTHISHLRSKIAPRSGGRLLIRSVLGVGYVLSQR